MQIYHKMSATNLRKRDIARIQLNIYWSRHQLFKELVNVVSFIKPDHKNTQVNQERK